MENLAAFSASKVNSAAVERRVFLSRRSVQIDVERKVIPISCLKIEWKLIVWAGERITVIGIRK